MKRGRTNEQSSRSLLYYNYEEEKDGKVSRIMITFELSWSVVCAMSPSIVVDTTYVCAMHYECRIIQCIWGKGGCQKYLYHQNFEIVWQNRIVSWLWFEVSATY